MVHRFVAWTKRDAANQPVGWILADGYRLAVPGAPQIDGDGLADDRGHRDAAPPGGVLQVAIDSLGESKIGRDVARHELGLVPRYHGITWLAACPAQIFAAGAGGGSDGKRRMQNVETLRRFYVLRFALDVQAAFFTSLLH